MIKSPEYVLYTYCVPGTVLGPEDGALNKTALAPCCHEAHGPEKQRVRELTEASFQIGDVGCEDYKCRCEKE